MPIRLVCSEYTFPKPPDAIGGIGGLRKRVIIKPLSLTRARSLSLTAIEDAGNQASQSSVRGHPGLKHGRICSYGKPPLCMSVCLSVCLSVCMYACVRAGMYV